MFGLTRPHEINWITTSFLLSTFLIAAIGTPLYIYHFGLHPFLIGYFLFMFSACCMSITLGYHRLFAHGAFKASWPVKFITLLFGAAAFENSALMWTSEHRKHHKHVDHDDDPYDISKGFFYAHIGWLFLRFIPHRELDNVQDLRKDKMVMFQHDYVQIIATFMSFIIPMAVGWLWNGAVGLLGCLIICGFLRVLCVHHVTFFINSLCHTVGNRPYSSRCSARDSWLMAIFTFGEGYHNYHHEFQHDYRNGVKPWQWDPTKWTIWLLHKVGLVRDLRRVPQEKIILAQIEEKQRHLESRIQDKTHLLPLPTLELLNAAKAHLAHTSEIWEQRRRDYVQATERNLEISREKITHFRREMRVAARNLQTSIRVWQKVHHSALAESSYAAA